MTKITQRMFIENAIALMEDADYIAKGQEMLASLDAKKTSKKNSAKAKENEGIKEVIKTILTEPMRCKAVMDKVNAELGTDYSSNKISRLLKELKDSEVVKREVIKGDAYFSLV